MSNTYSISSLLTLLVLEMVVSTSSQHLHDRLKIAAQTVGWTYTIFWKICPQQRILVWGDGYYNGGIKTVKTVTPVEDSIEEVRMEVERSQQLKELYDSLAGGEESNNQGPAVSSRRASPSAGALSPEDLTETEWFYLMCISFSFPPGVGLPGKAFVKWQHQWLNTANQVNSNVFLRAVLAKSACIRTVVCIPILDGVVELGTTQKVEEDNGLIKTIKALFFINPHELPIKPALSQHSTSNPTTPPSTSSSSSKLNLTDKYQIDVNEDEEYEDEDEGAEEPLTILSGSGTEMEALENDLDEHCHDQEQRALELIVQLDADDMPEDIRIGSDNGSNTNVEYYSADFSMFVAGKSPGTCPHPTSGLSPMCNEMTEKERCYSQTVSTVLQPKPNHMSNSSSSNYLNMHSPTSVFTKFPASTTHNTNIYSSSSQSILKSILFSIPLQHSKEASSSSQDVNACPIVSNSQLHKTHSEILQEETSVSHVLAERRRREKLNERFIILRSIVPFVTKMDKASILGDTIEYVKQLKKKIQELETSKTLNTKNVTRSNNGKRKVEVEVSIIENDALVELQCHHREGLLLDVMQILRELKVEVTIVHSSLVNNGFLVAELRAKVKENINGKRVSIAQVKRSLLQVIIPT